MIAVVEGLGQRGVHVGTVEGGERNDGAPPHSGLVACGVENGGQAADISDGAEGGDRRFAYEGIFVARRQATQRGHRRVVGVLTLPTRPGRHFDDRRVAVREGGGE
jgi:hypothetical protein